MYILVEFFLAVHVLLPYIIIFGYIHFYKNNIHVSIFIFRLQYTDCNHVNFGVAKWYPENINGYTYREAK